MAEMLENDLIWGIRNIAAAINQNPRQVHYLLSQGLLPAGQVGEKWVVSRRALQAHFAQLTSKVKKRAA